MTKYDRFSDSLYFDAYRISSIHHLEIVNKLSSLMLFDLTESRGQNGFESGFNFSRGDSVIGRYNFGGDVMRGRGTIEFYGYHAQEAYDFLRSHFRNNYDLLRADIALDVRDHYWVLADFCRTFAITHDLKTSVAGDWVRHIGGKTLYIGSRQSTNFVRLYEKSKQLNPGSDDNLVRFELECKPAKANRSKATYMTPSQLFFTCPIAVAYLNFLFQSNFYPDPPLGAPRRLSDIDRALFHMKKQYDKVILSSVEKYGLDFVRDLLFDVPVEEAHSFLLESIT